MNLSVFFNSPLEAGLRLLFLFNNTQKRLLDTQRLIFYNYLLIHSSDIPNAPKSLHPDMPNRACEMVISRKIIKKGLNLLLSKDLICVKYSKTGIKFKPNKNTSLFINYLSNDYSKELNERAKWVCDKFDDLSDTNLNKFIQANFGKWGSEFSKEYIGE
ncbi:MAG: ABC-three component system middle component 2 [Candidatus Nanoarchaeia archaeon]|jgi:hypothetical protein